MVRPVVAVAVVVAVLATAGCGDRRAGSDAGSGKVDVVASFYPLAEAARRVGGERASVRNLTPAGVEPHDLELRPSQVDTVEDADLVLYVGGGFQPAVAKVAARRSGASVDLLPADARRDPHFWLDPTRLAAAADAIAAAMSKVDPAGRATFEANAAAYRAELAQLDGELSTGLATCERRELVTSHAAFAYLARRYGLTQLAIASLSPEAEPSAGRLAELGETIRDHHATTVFSEELVSPRVAQALAREAGVTTAVLNPLEGLTKAEQEAGDDYATVMRRNLGALRKALGCSDGGAPEAATTTTTTTPSTTTTSAVAPAAAPAPAAIAPIPDERRATMVSWRPGCPVSLDDLRIVRVRYLGFDGADHDGELVVHRDAAQTMATAFAKLFEARFPIERVEPVDAFGGDDDASMAANNTSAFNCRKATGSSSWSEHAFGRAVDINPVQNPYVTASGHVSPPAGAAYTDRSHPAEGLITADGPAVAAFAGAGWGWGGSWRSTKDYQHFSASGR